MLYLPGSLQDKLLEAFSGTHDVIGGKIIGFYDGQGNITRGMSKIEDTAKQAWSAAAIVASAPFAMAELLPPQVWQAIAVLLKEAR